MTRLPTPIGSRGNHVLTQRHLPPPPPPALSPRAPLMPLQARPLSGEAWSISMVLRGQESGRDGAARGSNLGKYGTGANLGGHPGVRGDVPRGRAGMGDGALAGNPSWSFRPGTRLTLRSRGRGARVGTAGHRGWRDPRSLRGRKAGPAAGTPSREQRLVAGGASLDHRA